MFAKCSFPLCWEAQCGKTEFCNLHNKVNGNKAHALIQDVFNTIGPKTWHGFIKTEVKPLLKEGNLIFESDFKRLLSTHQIKFSEEDFKCLCWAFPGRHEGSSKSINLHHLLSLQQLPYDDSKIYENIELSDEEDKQFYDASGYTGIQHWAKIYLEPITFDELISIVQKSQTSFGLVWRSIREIDQENNGYVTNTELDDIFKLYFADLEARNLKKLFKPYQSIQNKILIDYKTLKKQLMDKVNVFTRQRIDKVKSLYT